MHMPLGNQTRNHHIIVLLPRVGLVDVPHANAQSAPAVYQVVSGLRKYMPLDALMGRRVVLVANMKPAAMRGVKSQAMVLCASSPDGAQARAPLVTRTRVMCHSLYPALDRMCQVCHDSSLFMPLC